MNDDVVAKIKSIAPDTWLRISYHEPSRMDQGWLKVVDFDAETLTLKNDFHTATVWINNIRSADDIDTNHTGSGAAGPAVEGGKRWNGWEWVKM